VSHPVDLMNSIAKMVCWIYTIRTIDTNMTGAMFGPGFHIFLENVDCCDNTIIPTGEEIEKFETLREDKKK
jgi:hypothetical protein